MGEQLDESKMTLREQVVMAICNGFRSAAKLAMLEEPEIHLVVKDDETEIHVNPPGAPKIDPIRVTVDPPDVIIPESWPNRTAIASGIRLDVQTILADNAMKAEEEQGGSNG